MYTVVADSQLTFLMNVSDSNFTIYLMSAKTIQIHIDVQN